MKHLIHFQQSCQSAFRRIYRLQAGQAAEVLNETNEAPTNSSVVDKFVNWSLKDKAESINSANDNRIETSNDNQIEGANDNDPEAGQETSLGKGGGSSSGKKTKAQKIEVLDDPEISPVQEEMIDRSLTKLEAVTERRGLSGKIFGWLTDNSLSEMTQVEKLEYLNDLRKQSYGEIWKDESLGFWGKIKTSILKLGVNWYANTKTGKEVFKVVEVSTPIIRQTEETIEDAEELVKNAEENIDGARQVRETYRTNPVLSPSATRAKIIEARNDFQRSFAQTREMMKEPERMRRFTSQAGQKYLELVNSPTLDRATVESEVRNKRVPGVSMVGHGRLAALRLTVNEVFDGMRTGNWEKTAESLGSQQFRQMLAESIIPIYGTMEAYERRNDEMAGPKWARTADLYLSGAADALMVGGMAAAGIGAAAGGAPAIPGLIVAGVGAMLKGGLRLTSKIAMKFASKKGRRDMAKKAGKEIAQETSLRAAFEGVLIGMQAVYDKMYPDGIIAEVKHKAYQVAANQLSPTQQHIAKRLGYFPV